MTQDSFAKRARRSRGRGFTLTEVLIALALVSLLLVGISRIFALTSETIGVGQALSTAMRSQRAVQQVLSQDFLGAGNLGVGRSNGMMPLIESASPTHGAPFLTISNFRIAAYRNEADARSDSLAPTDANTNFVDRSRLIRGIDLDGDGSETEDGDVAKNELTPLYSYGTRNFRCDTLSFFINGRFQSQTESNAVSGDAYVWYGHLRIFNGNSARIGYSNAYGPPGERLTPGSNGTAVDSAGPNRNNLYADSFMLGRYQMLMIEPTDHDGDPATESTVIANDDLGNPIAFAARTWTTATDAATNASPSPFNFSGTAIRRYYLANAANAKSGVNGVLDARGDPRPNPRTPARLAPDQRVLDSRWDVIGAGAQQMRDRIRNLSGVPAYKDVWTRDMPCGWLNRFYVNPFITWTDPSNPGLDRSLLAQRQQILATSCPQFIVEFAGDFVTQGGSGAVTGARPDGVLDFVASSSGVREVRWYGLPRDVSRDGVSDGKIVGTGTAMASSPDVIPVRDFAGSSYPFEREESAGTILPPSADYGQERIERGSDPSATRYVCVWGANDFEIPYGGTKFYAVPQLIRVIVEVVDDGGKLKQPVSQEYVFPVARR